MPTARDIFRSTGIFLGVMTPSLTCLGSDDQFLVDTSSVSVVHCHCPQYMRKAAANIASNSTTQLLAVTWLTYDCQVDPTGALAFRMPV